MHQSNTKELNLQVQPWIHDLFARDIGITLSESIGSNTDEANQGIYENKCFNINSNLFECIISN